MPQFLRRRDLLASLGLGAGAPIFGAFANTIARASSASPRPRIIFFHENNGIAPERIRVGDSAKAEGALTQDLAFPKALEPLSDIRDRLLIVENLHNPHGQSLHGNSWNHYTGTAPTKSPWPEDADINPGGITIDRLIGKTVGAGDAHDSLVFVPILGDRRKKHEWMRSADGPGLPAFSVMEFNPFSAFERLFGKSSGPSSAGQTERMVASKRSVLDFVIDDVARMQARLPGEHKERLDVYVGSLRSAEMRLGKLLDSTRSCSNVARPQLTASDRSAEFAAVNVPNTTIQDEWENAFVDLAVLALSCGMTHVLNLVFACGGAHLKYSALIPGWPDFSDHQIAHGNRSDALTSEQLLVLKHQRNLRTLRRLWDALAKIPEGQGTLADHTMIVWNTDAGGAHHNGYNKIPAIIVGDGGGRLNTGRYLRFPDRSRAINDLWVSLAHAMDIPMQTFGDAKICKGPLPTAKK
jgi:hypothetical protein